MATWGAHFRIAENILKEYPNLNRSFFAIGNIAPDCGIPNENWTSFTPPKDVSHFTVSRANFLEIKLDKFILNDIEFFSCNYTSLTPSTDFFKSYFFIG